jgi:hypothetical protein
VVQNTRGRPRNTDPFGRNEVSVFPSPSYESIHTSTPIPTAQPTPDQGISRHTTSSIRRQLSAWEYGDSLSTMDAQDTEEQGSQQPCQQPQPTARAGALANLQAVAAQGETAAAEEASAPAVEEALAPSEGPVSSSSYSLRPRRVKRNWAELGA